jgi:prepilin peptidase CpaA
MFGSALIPFAGLLIPLAIVIAYHDIKYRRIPNSFVAATLLSGIIMNSVSQGWSGAINSLAGCSLGFIMMFTLHVFGAMGAGDVKLFAAVGSVMGAQLVLPTFLIVVLTGGLLAFVATIRLGMLRTTLHRTLQILVGLMPGWEMPKFAIPADRRQTIPYGVAITLGSLVSLAIFRF